MVENGYSCTNYDWLTSVIRCIRYANVISLVQFRIIKKHAISIVEQSKLMYINKIGICYLLVYNIKNNDGELLNQRPINDLQNTCK